MGKYLKKHEWHNDHELYRYEYKIWGARPPYGYLPRRVHVLCSKCVEKVEIDSRMVGRITYCGHYYADVCEVCGKSGFELDPRFEGASARLIDTAINGNYEERSRAYSQLIDYAVKNEESK